MAARIQAELSKRTHQEVVNVAIKLRPLSVTRKVCVCRACTLARTTKSGLPMISSRAPGANKDPDCNTHLICSLTPISLSWW